MMYKCFLFFCFYFLTQHSYCQELRSYTRISKEGLELLTFNDSTYDYLFYTTPAIGKYDTLKHSGYFFYKNDSLILNSFKRPNNYSIIKVKESNMDPADSMFFIVKNESFSPDFPLAYLLKINRYEEYFLATSDSLKLIKQPVLSIIVRDYFSDYPILYTKNNFANFYEITIKKIDQREDIYKQGSYFIDENFLVEPNGIYRINSKNLSECDFYKIDSDR